MDKPKTTAPQQFMFAAIDPVIERLIEAPTERKQGDDKWVLWGDKNTYPYYIKGLCKTVPTLRSVIMGSVDFTCGDDVTLTRGLVGREPFTLSRKGLTGRELIRETSSSVFQIGGFAWKVTLNRDLETVGEIEPVPIENLRTNADRTLFWYSEKFEKGLYVGSDVKVYPAWQKNTRVPETIYYCSLWSESVYPEPLFAASVKACETERSVDEFHLGNIERGFMGSYLVNFNDGKMPTAQEKKEVEKSFTEKFAGKKNAGRIMFCWNRSKDGMTTFQKMEVSDYGEKYETLSKHCRQQIFTAFRANPNLFGIPTENNGFNAEEYESTFRLFNRTTVQPVQKTIVEALAKIVGEDIIRIKPFSLDGTTEDNVR